jgi:error-prone DNA polymerase
MYFELQCKTHYSFLEGASSPQEIIKKARELGLGGVAITDRHGVYGLPKAYLATKSHEKENSNFKLLTGAQLKVEALPFVTLIAQDRSAYGLLCEILTQAHLRHPKGQAALPWHLFIEMVAQSQGRGLIALPDLSLEWDWGVLKDIFQHLYLPVSRFLDSQDRLRFDISQQINHKFNIKQVATNDVHYHCSHRAPLQDVQTCIRHHVELSHAGFNLFSNHERYLKSEKQMLRLFKDHPDWVHRTEEIAQACQFSLSELRYRYPSEWIPQGQTAQSYLDQLVWKGALNRYPHSTPDDVKAQLHHELNLIKKLEFADYFLTIWEIVEFAKQRGILCQGRGSAANSAVCYVLGITAVDPVRMNLLFERFISAERGEPPDIDIDFEHERREEVIQHVYEKYGRHRAAMVSAVITYRSRSAIRQVTQVFGREMDQREFEAWVETHPASPQVAQQKKIIDELKGFPRHLSIHSGGFTLSADPMSQIVPIEPARMEGRTIVQWDKYDLDALGLLKVDLLSLGMLTAIRKTMDLVGGLSLSQIPPEDPLTYEMIQRGDTVGTFQIESRAQISMLPRLLPKCFYDLVVEVALVRPGPIVGKMVHPYLRRRKGLEPVWIPDSRLEPILRRTLGVPIFQEQVMKMAIVLADFTPGEADQLRRAIGAWRSSGSIDQLGQRLMQGLQKNGIPQQFAELIFQQIQGFAEYGFPESHAASFALIAYASAYLKRHHPAEFLCGILNSQPMGFYTPHTLVDDAKRHGVAVLPINPQYSEWDCVIQTGAVRLGFRYVSGISHDEVLSIISERSKSCFRSLKDFLGRVKLKRSILHRLALGHAFDCFGLDSRSALWEILLYSHVLSLEKNGQLNLFSYLDLGQISHQTSSDLHSYQREHQEQKIHSHSLSDSFPKEMIQKKSEYEHIQDDYQAYGLSVRGHPMGSIRHDLPGALKLTSAQVKARKNRDQVIASGLVLIMQRPPTAAGTVFAMLEDEAGFLDLIFHAKVFEKYKSIILDHCFLVVSGGLQKEGQSVSLLVESVRVLPLDFFTKKEF